MLRFLPLFALGFVVRAVFAAEVPSGTLIDGKTFRGTLAAVKSDWTLQFFDRDDKTEIAAADLAFWGSFAAASPGTQILLAGGGLIIVDTARIEKELITGQSAVLGSVRVPIELLAAVILQPPSDCAAYDQLVLRLTALDSQVDRVLLDNGDELTGTILGLDDKGVQLESDDGRLTVASDNVIALAFNATLVQQPRLTGLRMLTGFSDGGRLIAAGISSQQDQVRLKLAGGAEWTASLSAVVALQTLGGRSQYLSDLTPASYKHLPYLTLSWPYRNDRSVSGGQLRAGGRLAAKGLGMHSPSRITYDLPVPVRRFDAEVAIDDDASGRGSVVFRVFIDDGSGTWQERLSTPVVRGGQPPLPVSVDVSGGKRISLLVDYADRGDELDHADWLNARVSP